MACNPLGRACDGGSITREITGQSACRLREREANPGGSGAEDERGGQYGECDARLEHHRNRKPAGNLRHGGVESVAWTAVPPRGSAYGRTRVRVLDQKQPVPNPLISIKRGLGRSAPMRPCRFEKSLTFGKPSGQILAFLTHPECPCAGRSDAYKVASHRMTCERIVNKMRLQNITLENAILRLGRRRRYYRCPLYFGLKRRLGQKGAG